MNLGTSDKPVTDQDGEQKALAITFFQKGLVYLAAGKAREAIKEFSQAQSYDPKNAEIYLNRGLAYEFGTHLIPNMIKDYEQALALDPNLGDLYQKRRNEIKQVTFEQSSIDYSYSFGKVEFEYSESQNKRFDQWVKNLDRTYEGASGGAFTFTFTPHGVGEAVTVTYSRLPIFHKLGLKDEILDLSIIDGFENW